MSLSSCSPLFRFSPNIRFLTLNVSLAFGDSLDHVPLVISGMHLHKSRWSTILVESFKKFHDTIHPRILIIPRVQGRNKAQKKLFESITMHILSFGQHNIDQACSCMCPSHPTSVMSHDQSRWEIARDLHSA